MARIAWFHFSAEHIPADWEVTAYAVEPRIGRLEFSNRHGYQAMLSWEPCRHEPDRQTTMRTFLEHLRPGAEAPARDAPLHTATAGSFLLGWGERGTPAQALAYRPDQKTLLRWVFEDGSPEAVSTRWRPLLESVQPNDGPWCAYALFGLNFRLPADFVIEEMNTLPANVRICFEGRHRRRATFRRWGMPAIVLQHKGLTTFYRDLLHAQGCRGLTLDACRLNGMEAVQATYSQRGEHQMDRIMGRDWEGGQATLWLNPDEQRLYSFEQIGPRRSQPLTLTEVLPPLNPRDTPHG